MVYFAIAYALNVCFRCSKTKASCQQLLACTTMPLEIIYLNQQESKLVSTKRQEPNTSNVGKKASMLKFRVLSENLHIAILD